MKVGLIDVDRTDFPNLVLMKLSSWYKAKGHETVLLHPADVINGQNLFGECDEMIGACVFDWNQHTCDLLEKCGVNIGGVGSKYKEKVLTEEQEHSFPDYSLYGITEKSFGFLTRGCPRHCPFCVVGDKEGLVSRKVANLDEFWNGQKEIQILDPNILACDQHMELLQQLAESGAWVEFNQGLDARMLTEENIEMLKMIKIKRIHFAWDNPKDKKVPKALEMFADRWGVKPGDHRIVVYVLTNYWSDLESDLMRVYWLKGHGFSPYVMIFDKQNASKQIRHLQRWVNNRYVFYKTPTFEEYKNNKEEHK